VTLCLAAGHIRNGNHAAIQDHCDRNGWRLFSEEWLGKQFSTLATADYENDIAIVAAKLARLAVLHHKGAVKGA
jgi:hypothetical protein